MWGKNGMTTEAEQHDSRLQFSINASASEKLISPFFMKVKSCMTAYGKKNYFIISSQGTYFMVSSAAQTHSQIIFTSKNLAHAQTKTAIISAIVNLFAVQADFVKYVSVLSPSKCIYEIFVRVRGGRLPSHSCNVQRG